MGDEVEVSESAAALQGAARRWPALARFIAAERQFAKHMAQRGPVGVCAYEFVRFGVKQAWACLFGALLLGLLIGTHLFYPRGAWLPRYDFLVLSAVLIQITMLRFGLETWEEAKVILIFHIVGTVMEIFKTHVGSWHYPEASLLRLGSVPLFTGFMYAAIGSYIARCWRLFDFQFTRHPPMWAIVVLAVAIYVNFFTHHFVMDVRNALFVAAALLFGLAWVHFRIHRVHRRMPLLLGFVLVALFIWFAENIGTFTAAWVYPSQKTGWHMVSFNKLGAWFLLMIISYVLVAMINTPRRMQQVREPSGHVAAVRP
ncbi:MAG: DUF817 domain-containing protein [Hyphomicrobiaceae bacterium]